MFNVKIDALESEITKLKQQQQQIQPMKSEESKNQAKFEPKQEYQSLNIAPQKSLQNVSVPLAQQYPFSKSIT